MPSVNDALKKTKIINIYIERAALSLSLLTLHLVIVKIANVKGVGGVHFASRWDQRRIIPKPIEPLPIDFFEPFVALLIESLNTVTLI